MLLPPQKISLGALKAATWEEALALVADKMAGLKGAEMAAVVGPLADAEVGKRREEGSSPPLPLVPFFSHIYIYIYISFGLFLIHLILTQAYARNMCNFLPPSYQHSLAFPLR